MRGAVDFVEGRAKQLALPGNLALLDFRPSRETIYRALETSARGEGPYWPTDPAINKNGRFFGLFCCKTPHLQTPHAQSGLIR